jgi:heat shock protein HslJ
MRPSLIVQERGKAAATVVTAASFVRSCTGTRARMKTMTRGSPRSATGQKTAQEKSGGNGPTSRPTEQVEEVAS